ncbi:MAG: MFS transporter [Proteobacteria bacterium]|nr:MFS transporter [Pseudomonadota bacterium]
MKWLLLALGSMFVQQTFTALGKVVPAIIAPAIFLDLQLDPALLGIYFAISAAAALIVQTGCGSFILRYGSLRISQFALVSLAAGMAIAVHGHLAMFVLSAIIGAGFALSTPASSHLLGRYSPPKYAPLVFSIKQTAVPAGMLIGGLIGPFLSDWVGWRGALLVIAASCVVFAVMLEPLHKEFDSDKDMTRKFRISDFKGTIMLAIGITEIRNLSFACFIFNGLQQMFTTFFVVYLVHLGHTLAAAGVIFSIATAVAVPGRIFWGWLSSGYVSPRVLMAILSIGMAVTVAATGLFEAGWPVLMLTGIASGVTATVFSWHGVLLAEAVRLAPRGSAASVTGGMLSFGQLGALIMPLVYSLLLSLTGSYRIGFFICAVPALIVGLALLLPPRRTTAKPED